MIIEKQGVGASSEEGVNLNSPPYAIHNGMNQFPYTIVVI
jgi:hypothetical protein